MDEFKGKWYISAGLNPLFDIFDCQVRVRRWKKLAMKEEEEGGGGHA